MAELRSQIPDELAERIEEVMEKSNLYSKKSELIREAVRNQIRRDVNMTSKLEELEEE